MLSLKTFIDNAATKDGSFGSRVISILLDAFWINAVKDEDAGYRTFTQDLQRIRKQFETAAGEESAMELAREAVRCLERYGSASERCAATRAQNFRQTVALLTAALLKVSHGSTEAARNLKKVGEQIEAATGSSDLTTMKEDLRVCLSAICSESDRQSEHRTSIATSLKAVESLMNIETETDSDPLTGLGASGDASRLIRQLITTGGVSHVMAFAVERLETVNMRFGFHAGDQMLLLFAQHLAQHLAQGDILFRWRGPCFVVVSTRNVPEPSLAGEAARVSHSKLAHTISMGSREVSVPITSSWSMFRLTSGLAPDDIVRRIDEFAIHRMDLNTPIAR